MAHKILSVCVMFSILISLVNFRVFAEDTQQSYEETRTEVNRVQTTDPNLPTWVPNQKGSIGFILSRMFDSNGRIGNYFLKALWNRSDDRVLRWEWWNGGQLVNGSIYDTGTNVWIWASPSFAFDVLWDINFTWNIRKNGTVLDLAWKFVNGATSGEIYYNGWNVGIGNTNPNYTLDVTGTINATNLRGNWSQITNINGVNITNGTIDTTEITDNSLTSNDLAPWSVGSSEIIDSSITSTDILNNTITASDIWPNAINNSELAGDSVAGVNIINNTITEADIADNFVARDSTQLWGVNSTSYVRNDAANTFTEKVTITNPDYDNHLRIQRWTQIWDISPSTDGSLNIFKPGGGWQNRLEVPGIESASRITVWGTNVFQYWDSGDNILNNTIDSSEIQDNTITGADILNDTITANDIASNAVWNLELNNASTFTMAWIRSFVNSNTPLTNVQFWRDSANQYMTFHGWSSWNYLSSISSDANKKSFRIKAIGWTEESDFVFNYGWLFQAPSIAGNGSQITSIAGDNITDGTIDGTEIQDNSLTASDLAVNSVGTSELTTDSVTSAKIVNNTITASDIGADAINASELANNSVWSANIIANSIWAWDLAPNSVGNSELQANISIGQLNLTNNSDVTLSSTANALTVWWIAWENIAVDWNEIQARNNWARDDLNLQLEWWTLSVWGGFFHDSDRHNTDFIVADSDKGGVTNAIWYDYSSGRTYLWNTGWSGTNPEVTIRWRAQLDTEWTGTNDLVTKGYIDNLVSQWVSWKAPTPSGSTPAGTYWACNASREWWATYNLSDDIIYLCNASAWVSIGNSASVPYATTTTAGRMQIAGDLQGTWNNITIKDGVINSANIANNTLTADDIAPNSINQSELAANSIISGNIVNNTITADDIASNAIWNSELIDNPTFATVLATGYGRSGHNIGHLVGSYNNIWANASYTNPIYTIGSNYNPASTTLSNMYGVWYTSGSSVPFVLWNGSWWGMYVAADGDARAFISGASGWNSYFNANGWNVGIGTTSPERPLHVSGTIKAGSASATNGSTMIEWIYSWTDVANTLWSYYASAATVLWYWVRTRNWAAWYVSSADNVAWNRWAIEMTNELVFKNAWAAVVSEWSVVNLVERFKVDASGNTTISWNLTVWGWINGDSITDNTIDSSEIQNDTITSSDILNNTLTASDIGPNSINNSELAANAVISGNIVNNTITEADIADNFKARDANLLDWVDSTRFLRSDANDTMTGDLTLTRNTGQNLLSWAGWFLRKVTNQWWFTMWSDSSVILHAWDASASIASDVGVTAWTTNETLYLTADDRVQITTGRQWGAGAIKNFVFNTNGTATFDGNTVLTSGSSIPGDSIIDGTIDSSEIQDNTIQWGDILNNTITENDISDTFVARNSQLLDWINSTSFVRTTWSQWISNNWNNVLNLNLTNASADTILTLDSSDGVIAWGSYFMRATDGATERFSINWLGNVNIGWSLTIGWSLSWDSITDNTIDSSEIQNGTIGEVDMAQNQLDDSEIQDNSLTAGSLAANSVGNSELIDNPTVNTIYAPNWFRSSGNSGWFNETHGWWIRMIDSTYVRTYANKNFIVGDGDSSSPNLLYVHGWWAGQNEWWEIRISSSADHDGTYDYYFMDSYQDDFRIGRAWVGNDIVLKNTWNVGIGTSAPTQKLDVNGTIVTRWVNSIRYRYWNHSLINRQDGSNFYMLLTNSGDQDWSFNWYRPFRIWMWNWDVALDGDTIYVNANSDSVGIDTSTISSWLRLDVHGKVWADEYCDRNGNNCIPAGWSGVPDTETSTPWSMPVGSIMLAAIMPWFNTKDWNVKYGDVVSGYYLCPSWLDVYDTNDNDKIWYPDSTNSRVCNDKFAWDWINLWYVWWKVSSSIAKNGTNTVVSMFQKVRTTATYWRYYWADSGNYWPCSAPAWCGTSWIRTAPAICRNVINDSIVNNSNCSGTPPTFSIPCSDSSQCRCFVAGTYVTMADGTKKDIATIKPWELVLWENWKANIVLGIDRSPLWTRQLYSFNWWTNFVTAEHPFLTEDGWKSIDVEALRADDASLIDKLSVDYLRVWDSIIAENGESILIESIDWVSSHAQTVYNLKLTWDGTYYADGYVTHNKY